MRRKRTGLMSHFASFKKREPRLQESIRESVITFVCFVKLTAEIMHNYFQLEMTDACAVRSPRSFLFFYVAAHELCSNESYSISKTPVQNGQW